MRDSLLFCWVGLAPCYLTACAGERAALGQFDPIQALGTTMPWLSCVGESGSRYEDDFDVVRRRWGPGQTLWMFPPVRNHSLTLASDQLVGQCRQDLNILDNTGLFAMVLGAILALHEGQSLWLTIQ